jgi:hypothetical protein
MHYPWRRRVAPLRGRNTKFFPGKHIASGNPWTRPKVKNGGINMNISELKKLSKTERIQAMEALWESMLYEDGEVETP